ncbi:MAG: ATP-binding protein [Thiolinea sp.]
MLLLVLMPVTVFLISWIMCEWGLSINWRGMTVGVAVGVVIGVAYGAIIRVTEGVAIGVPLGVAFGIFLAVHDVPIGITIGAAFGTIVGVAEGVTFGMDKSVSFNVFLCLLLGVGFGVVFDVAGGVALIFFYFRLWVYPFEFLQQSVLYFTIRTPFALSIAPIFYHELSYFPLPFLGRMIEDTAAVDIGLARKALARCSIIPGQRRIGARTLVKLQARELAEDFQCQQFEKITELKGEWLPGISKENDEALERISEIGRYLQAYKTSVLPHRQLQHLEQAQAQLKRLQNYLLGARNDWSLANLPLADWRNWMDTEWIKIHSQAEKEIPNPFYYGQPLTPEIGNDVFRGREEVVTRIEQLLSDHNQSLSIALLGPRRCGKSSLLKMLPSQLPSAFVVFFDLQDNPADSVEGFFRALVKRAQEQTARQHRGIILPDLPEGTPFEAASAWLEQLDDKLDKTLLICMDEFERLPRLFPGAEHELFKLMSLFRATIQHRKNIRLLVSGAAPFDELEHIWNDNFINVQEIRLPHLNHANGTGLLRHPIHTFPADTISAEVADTIYQRTNGQPFLLQAFGGLAVEHLNHIKKPALLPDMLDTIEEEVMKRGNYYFTDVYQSAPPAAQQILHTLAQGQACAIDPASLRWLKRRLLLNEDNQLSIPTFGRWIREFADVY